MPKMRLTLTAHHFGPSHAVASIGLGLDLRFVLRRCEAWPPGPGIEFRFRFKERFAAANALVHSGRFGFPEFTGKCRFGPFAARDVILLGRQLRAPFGVGLLNFVARRFLAHKASTTGTVLGCDFILLQHAAAQPGWQNSTSLYLMS